MRTFVWLLLVLSAPIHAGKPSLLRDRVNTVLKEDLYQALNEQRSILPAGEADKILALLLKAEDIPIRIEETTDFAKGAYEDREGKPAKLSDDKNRMLDSNGVPCQGRVVRVAGTFEYFIQLDAGIWSELLSKTDSVAPAVVRLLFHEIIRLEWHRGNITSSDERSLVSNQLRIKRVNLELADFTTAPIGEGDEFVGEMPCERATFKEESFWDFGLSGGSYDFRRCKVRVIFKKGDTARYEVVLLADSRPYLLIETTHYSMEERKITFTHDEDRKVFDVGLNNDHISNVGDALFRIDRGAPSILGKHFGAEMFCDAAMIALRQRWSFWEPLHPGFNHYDKICTLELVINPSGDYMAVVRGEGPVPNVTAGRIEQIGHNVLLHVKDAEADWTGAYLWIARGRGGKELITTWGETIFENSTPQRQAVFGLAKEYRGEGNCGFFPGKDRGEREPCKLSLKINDPAEGLVELELESLKDGGKHSERGIALRSASIYAVWHVDKIKRSWNWRILKDQLVDGFGNRLNAVKPTPVP